MLMSHVRLFSVYFPNCKDGILTLDRKVTSFCFSRKRLYALGLESGLRFRLELRLGLNFELAVGLRLELAEIRLKTFKNGQTSIRACVLDP